MSIERLEELRDKAGLTKKDFAIALETTEQSYSHYTKGRRDIPLSVLKRAKQLYNVSLDWLVGDSDEFDSSKITSTTNLLSTVVMIPEYDVTLSAGSGDYPSEHALIVNSRPFSREWIKKKGLNPEKLSLVRVNGDSMEPLLKDKSIVMIAHELTIPNDAMPFAVRVDDTLYIKRVHKIGNKLILSSVNSIYKDLEIPMNECDCQIIGAVIRYAHSFI